MHDSASKNSCWAHLAGLDLFAEAPDVGARSDRLASIVAVQHRAARDDERRQVATGRAHHERGRRLVAAAEQHDAVEGVAADRLFDVHADEIAEEHRRRPQARLAGGHDGKLERQPAGFPHAALHVFGELAKVPVAGRQVGPRVADADDRPAVEHVARQRASHPAPVNEAVLVELAEPLGRAVRPLLFLSHCRSILAATDDNRADPRPIRRHYVCGDARGHHVHRSREHLAGVALHQQGVRPDRRSARVGARHLCVGLRALRDPRRLDGRPHRPSQGADAHRHLVVAVHGRDRLGTGAPPR